MRPCCIGIVCTALFLLLAGCGSRQPAGSTSAAEGDELDLQAIPDGAGSGMHLSDRKKVRAADVSILFVGNSHTMFHDLPNLVCSMIRFRCPDKKVFSHVVSVGHLDDTARNPTCRQEIESRPWKYVVLQAQKISMSGRYNYSRKEGIDIAKRARRRGATVFFFSEWGLKGVAGDAARNEKIYQEMADAADAGVAPVGRAWDLALSQRPDLPLHAPDGNHQSAVGAFLTACVLVGRLTGESPAPLSGFSYPEVDEKDRKFLADAAAMVIT
jgi:hypothetical protein